MGLFSSIKKRVLIQIVSIALYEQNCAVYIKNIKNGKVLHKSKKNFTLDSKDHLTKEVIAYLNSLQEQHEQTYIALFFNNSAQGVLPGCKTESFDKFSIDKNGVKHICINHDFTMYASKTDIKWLNKIFRNVGIDYIFSPFLILNHLLEKDNKVDKKDVTLYILNTHDSFTLVIRDNKKLLYGAFINLAKEEDLLYENFTDEESQSVDSIEDELFDFIESSDEIQEIKEDIDNSAEREQDELDILLSSKDSRFIKYLNASLKEFYHSELFESSFINKIKIYNSDTLSDELIKHIENELLINIDVDDIDVLDVVSKIAEEEIYSHA